MSFIQAAVCGHVKSEHAVHNLHQELLDYLSSPLDPSVDDPILWWGVSVCHCLNQKCAHVYLKHHQTQYPTLAKITWDYLAIQSSSVSLEHAFSGSGLTDTKAWNQLSSKTFEVLQILKSCYKDGLITVKEEVAAHERTPFVPVGSD